MKIILKEQTCHLLAEGAVFWEEQQLLFLADLHIGKAAFLRKVGIPIPEGNMKEDLDKITGLINKYRPKICVIVGDLIHAATGLTSFVIKTMADWLQSISCPIHLVLGNHDRSLLKNLPEKWPLHVHVDDLTIYPFCFSHYPKVDEAHFVWAGHIHPKIEIKNKTDRLVLPCFQIFSNQAILPAFGSFTGGSYVKKEKDCMIYAIADQMVVPIKFFKE